VDILGGIKKALGVVQPIRKASSDVGKALSPPPESDPTGLKAATARGDAARQEAISRGKGIEVKQTPTGGLIKKDF
jgi:hypothetical protein